jgi:hypothetical protein
MHVLLDGDVQVKCSIAVLLRGHLRAPNAEVGRFSSFMFNRRIGKLSPQKALGQAPAFSSMWVKLATNAYMQFQLE